MQNYEQSQGCQYLFSCMDPIAEQHYSKCSRMPVMYTVRSVDVSAQV